MAAVMKSLATQSMNSQMHLCLNKKRWIALRTKTILLQIHRGLLSPEQSDLATDEQVLSYVPEDGVSAIIIGEYEDDTPKAISISTAYTHRWVKKFVKQDNFITAYELMERAGFDPSIVRTTTATNESKT